MISKEKQPGILIIGTNMIIFMAYTLWVRSGRDNEFGFIAEAFFMAIHIVLCMVAAIIGYRRQFLISALVILLIGFSTCYISVTC
jgi:hypothetical protein